jgi:hypothetical protein
MFKRMRINGLKEWSQSNKTVFEQNATFKFIYNHFINLEIMKYRRNTEVMYATVIKMRFIINIHFSYGHIHFYSTLHFLYLGYFIFVWHWSLVIHVTSSCHRKIAHLLNKSFHRNCLSLYFFQYSQAFIDLPIIYDINV